MTQDPFAQPGASAPSGDPFGQPSGGGSYIKPADVFGELLLITPIKAETVPDNFNKGSESARLTADTVVLTGDHAGEEYSEMWWSNAPVVKAGETALRKGVKMILGRLRRFPVNEDKKAGKYQTAEDVEKAMVAWQPGMPNVRFAWALDQYDEADAQIARDYLAKVKSPF